MEKIIRRLRPLQRFQNSVRCGKGKRDCRDCNGCISSADVNGPEKAFFDTDTPKTGRSDYMGCTECDFGFTQMFRCGAVCLMWAVKTTEESVERTEETKGDNPPVLSAEKIRR